MDDFFSYPSQKVVTFRMFRTRVDAPLAVYTGTYSLQLKGVFLVQLPHSIIYTRRYGGWKIKGYYPVSADALNLSTRDCTGTPNACICCCHSLSRTALPGHVRAAMSLGISLGLLRMSSSSRTK
jgi:hypothetical protein